MTISKSLSPDALARLRICQKCVCGRGSVPDPAGEAHSAPQRPLTGFGGAFAAKRGMGGQEWEGKGRKKREGKAWQRRGRAPKTAYSRYPFLPQSAPALD